MATTEPANLDTCTEAGHGTAPATRSVHIFSGVAWQHISRRRSPHQRDAAALPAQLRRNKRVVVTHGTPGPHGPTRDVVDVYLDAMGREHRITRCGQFTRPSSEECRVPLVEIALGLAFSSGREWQRLLELGGQPWPSPDDARARQEEVNAMMVGWRRRWLGEEEAVLAAHLQGLLRNYAGAIGGGCARAQARFAGLSLLMDSTHQGEPWVSVCTGSLTMRFAMHSSSAGGGCAAEDGARILGGPLAGPWLTAFCSLCCQQEEGCAPVATVPLLTVTRALSDSGGGADLLSSSPRAPSLDDETRVAIISTGRYTFTRDLGRAMADGMLGHALARLRSEVWRVDASFVLWFLRSDWDSFCVAEAFVRGWSGSSEREQGACLCTHDDQGAVEESKMNEALQWAARVRRQLRLPRGLVWDDNMRGPHLCLYKTSAGPASDSHAQHKFLLLFAWRDERFVRLAVPAMLKLLDNSSVLQQYLASPYEVQNIKPSGDPPAASALRPAEFTDPERDEDWRQVHRLGMARSVRRNGADPSLQPIFVGTSVGARRVQQVPPLEELRSAARAFGRKHGFALAALAVRGEDTSSSPLLLVCVLQDGEAAPGGDRWKRLKRAHRQTRHLQRMELEVRTCMASPDYCLPGQPEMTDINAGVEAFFRSHASHEALVKVWKQLGKKRPGLAGLIPSHAYVRGQALTFTPAVIAVVRIKGLRMMLDDCSVEPLLPRLVHLPDGTQCRVDVVEGRLTQSIVPGGQVRPNEAAERWVPYGAEPYLPAVQRHRPLGPGTSLEGDARSAFGTLGGVLVDDSKAQYALTCQHVAFGRNQRDAGGDARVAQPCSGTADSWVGRVAASEHTGPEAQVHIDAAVVRLGAGVGATPLFPTVQKSKCVQGEPLPVDEVDALGADASLYCVGAMNNPDEAASEATLVKWPLDDEFRIIHQQGQVRVLNLESSEQHQERGGQDNDDEDQGQGGGDGQAAADETKDRESAVRATYISGGQRRQLLIRPKASGHHHAAQPGMSGSVLWAAAPNMVQLPGRGDQRYIVMRPVGLLHMLVELGHSREPFGLATPIGVVMQWARDALETQDLRFMQPSDVQAAT